MAAAGAEVIAFDQSETFIARAHQRAQGAPGSMTFYRVNAADEGEVLKLGEASFDAVVCTMAIMDMPEIEPMATWLPRMLKPHGRFVFSVVHPAFNSGHATLVAERNLGDGTLKYSVRADNYLEVKVTEAEGIVGQPAKHFYFERPMSLVLNTFFARGLLMDRMIEAGFEPREEPDYRLNWLNLQGIPQVLIARLRKP
jgi:SAM-dependent methyltransferase